MTAGISPLNSIKISTIQYLTIKPQHNGQNKTYSTSSTCNPRQNFSLAVQQLKPPAANQSQFTTTLLLALSLSTQQAALHSIPGKTKSCLRTLLCQYTLTTCPSAFRFAPHSLHPIISSLPELHTTGHQQGRMWNRVWSEWFIVILRRPSSRLSVSWIVSGLDPLASVLIDKEKQHWRRWEEASWLTVAGCRDFGSSRSVLLDRLRSSCYYAVV